LVEFCVVRETCLVSPLVSSRVAMTGLPSLRTDVFNNNSKAREHSSGAGL
jgi:hypothetical protein